MGCASGKQKKQEKYQEKSTKPADNAQQNVQQPNQENQPAQNAVVNQIAQNVQPGQTNPNEQSKQVQEVDEITKVAHKLIDKSQGEKFMQKQTENEFIDQYRLFQLISTKDKFLVAQKLYDETMKLLSGLKFETKDLTNIKSALQSNFGGLEFQSAIDILNGKQVVIADQCLYVIHQSYHAVFTLSQNGLAFGQLWFESSEKLVQAIIKTKQNLVLDIPQLNLCVNKNQGEQSDHQYQRITQDYLNSLYDTTLAQNNNPISPEKGAKPDQSQASAVKNNAAPNSNKKLEKPCYLDDEENIADDEFEHGALRTQFYQLPIMIKPSL